MRVDGQAGGKAGMTPRRGQVERQEQCNVSRSQTFFWLVYSSSFRSNYEMILYILHTYYDKADRLPIRPQQG